MTDIAEIQSYQAQKLETLIESTNTFPPFLKTGAAKDVVLNDLSLDVDDLAKQAQIIHIASPNISKVEIAIQLLGYLSVSAKSKFIRKITRKMISEEWWVKNGKV